MVAMEDVLDLYAEHYDLQRPAVCFDETSTQLLADIREPLPAKPGRPRREDYEYQRAGTRNLFLTCEPSTTTTLYKKGTLNPYSWRPAHTPDSFIVVPSSKRIQVKIPQI